MRKLSAILGVMVLLLAALIGFGLATSKVDPIVWEPGPNPGLTGDFAANDRLSAATLLLEGVGVGPEDITVGPDGALYTGYRDGRIVRFTADGDYQEFANTNGVPLGLRFDAAGRLIVADAARGILAISPQRKIEVLASDVDGKAMLFVDGLDIADDGTIWFTDASTRFDYSDNIYMFLEGRATGRLLSLAPATGEVTVHLDGLRFANGVAIGPNDEYVLVSETVAGQIRRLWLKGDKAGTSEAFFAGLPGAPDNLFIDDEGIVWVGIAGLRVPQIERLNSKTFLRRLLGALPAETLQPRGSYGFVVGIDRDANVRYNLQAPDSVLRTTTGARRVGDTLYISNLGAAAVGVLPIR